MYTIYNPNIMWTHQHMPVSNGPIYYTPVPSLSSAYVFNGVTPPAVTVNQSQPMVYHSQTPSWFPFTKSSCSGSISDDDVFISDSQSGESGIADIDSTVEKKPTKVVECQTEESCFKRVKRSTRSKRKKANVSPPSSCGDDSSKEDKSLSNPASSLDTNSPQFDDTCLDASKPPFWPSSMSNKKHIRLDNDLTLQDVFSASLCSAINADPSDSKLSKGIPPLKTSSPITEEDDNQFSSMININKLKTVHNRFLSSVTSERTLRFSENGWDVDLDNDFEFDFQSNKENNGQISTRREEFLKILDAERQRQKRNVLPKYAPKMNCKFCKNNGEPPEVYTKHRLHYNEKTVCPLLRHYVCRLCNSTGDFAHTIRHCPFNTRSNKLAWKATFL